MSAYREPYFNSAKQDLVTDEEQKEVNAAANSKQSPEQYTLDMNGHKNVSARQQEFRQSCHSPSTSLLSKIFKDTTTCGSLLGKHEAVELQDLQEVRPLELFE